MGIKDKIKEVIVEVETKLEALEAEVVAVEAPVVKEVENVVSTNPIIELAKAQAAFNKAKDIAHGFK
jgi:uncharacterized protein with PhoU and TrkA domain